MQLQIDPLIIRRNRQVLNAVPEWLTEAEYRKSRAGYGCPERLRAALNLPLDDRPTYTDLLVEAASRIEVHARYLEIGVSVGKNFYTLANVLEHADLVGLDWEPLGRVLANSLTPVDPAAGAYRAGSNRVTYLQGDVFDENVWKRLAGSRFNIVFSDALHQPHALRQEFAMLETFDLVDPEAFFLVWDDLDGQDDGPMTGVYREIADRIASRWGRVSSFVTRLNGWLGQHEHPHHVGVVTNLPFP